MFLNAGEIKNFASYCDVLENVIKQSLEVVLMPYRLIFFCIVKY